MPFVVRRSQPAGYEILHWSIFSDVGTVSIGVHCDSQNVQSIVCLSVGDLELDSKQFSKAEPVLKAVLKD